MWQELWSAKYTLSEEEFVDGILVVVICKSCIMVKGQPQKIALQTNVKLILFLLVSTDLGKHPQNKSIVLVKSIK